MHQQRCILFYFQLKKTETIFEKDFYLAPVEVIERMLAAHDVTDKIVLGPSAGSGNIVEWPQQNGAKEVIACEKNEKLRRIVAGKCRVVADNFLTLRKSYHVWRSLYQ